MPAPADKKKRAPRKAQQLGPRENSYTDFPDALSTSRDPKEQGLCSSTLVVAFSLGLGLQPTSF